ncbi:MAG: SURF1 family protein [Alphaproteobacteria bacterium]|nr:SURF1 family protein [Alphaproteobacteria bacterium]
MTKPSTPSDDARPTVEIGVFTFYKPTKGPILITILLVGLCLVLGIWQIQRLQWKQGLIAEMQAATQERIIKDTLPKDLNSLQQNNFYAIVLPGEFMHEHEMHMIGRSINGQPGYNVLTPFRIADDGRMILVNRGWIPQDKKKPEDRPEDVRFGGIVFASGFVSVPQGGSMFLPDHDVAGNVWFWPDIARINKEKNLDLPPVVIESVNANPVPDTLPIARTGVNVELRNDHLNYALMWFSLSFAGLVIFFIYHLKSVKGEE